jgi:hypothetical protein
VAECVKLYGLEASMVMQGTVNPPPLARLVRSQYNPPSIALLSSVAEVLFCKQGAVVRFYQGAPVLSQCRKVWFNPPGLGPGDRRFESFY